MTNTRSPSTVTAILPRSAHTDPADVLVAA